MISLPIHYVELENVYARTLGGGVSSLALASAQGDEGVSTLAYALARRAAAAGKKTLLIDFNLARPSVGERLALQSGEWVPDSASSTSAIIEFPSTGLAFLPATESRDSLNFRDVNTLRNGIARWAEDFDCIVADTSPLNRHNQQNIPPDIVCAACEATLLVVLAGRTTENQVLEANGRLAVAGARLAGSVLNDRFSPPLSDELCRETRRFERWAPKLMDTLRRRIWSSALLNQEI